MAVGSRVIAVRGRMISAEGPLLGLDFGLVAVGGRERAVGLGVAETVVVSPIGDGLRLPSPLRRITSGLGATALRRDLIAVGGRLITASAWSRSKDRSSASTSQRWPA